MTTPPPEIAPPLGNPAPAPKNPTPTTAGPGGDAAIHRHTLDNGLTLLAEPVPGAGSLAMRLMLPAGTVAEPADRQGVAAVLAEMMLRGAGGLTSREHSDALDRLGIDRSTDVTGDHLHVAATMIGSKLSDALPLLLNTALSPALDAADLDPSRDLAIQTIDGLDDEPQERAMLELKRRHHPDPLGRSTYGDRDHLAALTLGDVQPFARQGLTPQGAILAFAGAFDWDELRDQVERLAADWTGPPPIKPALIDAPRGYHHLTADSAQVHIALAADAVPEPDARSALQAAAVAVLSGGMSGRLFTEVREKRGLCYSVFAGYSGRRDRGTLSAYAGTTPPRAQETLDVMLAELGRLREGVSPEEFGRAIVGMKSRLVMQGESTGARAAAIAADQFILDRPRSLSELTARVDAITRDTLNAFLADQTADTFTLVTLGPQPLEPPPPGSPRKPPEAPGSDPRAIG